MPQYVLQQFADEPQPIRAQLLGRDADADVAFRLAARIERLFVSRRKGCAEPQRSASPLAHHRGTRGCTRLRFRRPSCSFPPSRMQQLANFIVLERANSAIAVSPKIFDMVAGHAPRACDGFHTRVAKRRPVKRRGVSGRKQNIELNFGSPFQQAGPSNLKKPRPAYKAALRFGLRHIPVAWLSCYVFFPSLQDFLWNFTFGITKQGNASPVGCNATGVGIWLLCLPKSLRFSDQVSCFRNRVSALNNFRLTGLSQAGKHHSVRVASILPGATSVPDPRGYSLRRRHLQASVTPCRASLF